MRKGIIAIIGIFAIGFLVVIAGFFLLDIERTALSYWAFGSLLFSLAVSFAVSIYMVLSKKNGDNVFFNSGVISATWIYEILIVMSIVLIKYFEGHVNVFVFVQLLINALFFIALILIKRASGHIRDMNVQANEKLQNGEYGKPKRGGF